MLNATLEAFPSPEPAAAIDPSAKPGSPLASLRRIPEVEALVDGFVASWHSSLASIQSRRWHRVRYEQPLIVTPLDEHTEQACGEAFSVTGRDISLTGLSFVHRQPLAHRKVAVTFPLDAETGESIVTNLRWCRFRRDGRYQSGGQFVRTVVLGPPVTEAYSMVSSILTIDSSL